MNRKKPMTAALLAALVIMLLTTVGSAVAATQTAVIDLEGLPEGKIVYTLSAGNGISGDPIGGVVDVWGHNPVRAWNTAVIFDGTCDGAPANCTGGDDDLFFPEQGNILIVDERGFDGNGDGIVDTPPNDADRFGAYLSFDFHNYGPGSVHVAGLTAMDIEYDEGEDGAYIEVWGGGNLLASVPIPNTGNNGKVFVGVNVSGVDFMKVVLNGSGAIDNIEVSVEEPGGGEGARTPGYWKNHPDAWPVENITIGGISYTKAQAIALMQAPVSNDKTYNMFEQLVATKLNLLMGTDPSCIQATVDAADAWMAQYPVGSNVKANSAAWQQSGAALHDTLDAYNNGLLCAPPGG